MKKSFAVISFIILAFCANSHSSIAQTVARTSPYFGIGDRGNTDTIIRETRYGARVAEAQIDFCFQEEPDGKWDRVVALLKVNGERLSGSGVSEIGAKAITFDILRKRGERSTAYNGLLRIGSRSFDVGYDFAVDLDDQNLRDPQTYTTIAEDPGDFSTVSPQTVAVRYRRGELRSVLNALRGEPIVLQPQSGYFEDCWTIRSGMQTLSFTTAPAKAPALVAKLRATPNVIVAGWSGFSWLGNAVRLPAASWSNGGNLDRDRIAAELIKSVAAALSATPSSSRWENERGELVVEFKRPSIRYAQAGFTETISGRFLAEPERYGVTDYFLIWTQGLSVTVADEGAEPRLAIAPFLEIGGEGIYIDQAEVTAAIARDLRGSVWIDDTEKWSAPK